MIIPSKFKLILEKNQSLEAEVLSIVSIFEPILKDLLNQLEGNTNCANGYNCTDYAIEMFNIITHQSLYPESGYRKPKDLYNILKKAIPIYLLTPKR